MLIKRTTNDIDCDKHGREEWQGHTICEPCGRVYTADEFKARFEIHDGLCYCGNHLVDSSFAICKQCYDERKGVKTNDNASKKN